MSRTRIMLMMSAAIPLAACGADDVASPGEGNIVVVTPSTPAPPPPPPPPSGPAPSTERFASITPAADCPMGTTNDGTIDGDDDGTVDFRICRIGGTITGTVRLEKLDGVVYSLNGRVDVGVDVGGDGLAAGGTQGILNIDPGVVVIGAGTADFLVVQRGSQLNAIGTQTQPITFTARANFQNETDGSGTVNEDSIGLFGGLVILGRAPINDCDGTATGGAADCQTEIEGTSGAFYGGDQAADDSGTLRYVQVRYPGFEVSTGNELNGISLGGVGSGTEISYVQVHNSSDDGFEWFGGTVNGDHLVVTGADDDSLDVDSGYVGVNQFIIVRQRAAGGDHFIEADSRFDDLPRSDPTFANFTFYGGGGSTDFGVLIREGIGGQYWNGVITGSAECLNVADQETIDDGMPDFQSVVIDCPTAFGSEGDISAADIQTLFNMGANNDASFTTSLTDGFVNGPNEDAVTAFTDPSIDTVDYIGAVDQAAATPWTQDWTCGLFGSDDQDTGSATLSCLVTPFYG
ncbi:hypothetical protein [Parasphingopyxis algicola]|uniref:hypothetical protein n=1 Tax=Parasphingopyxis algicola TaxID=2026624 RepID=UPI001C40AC3E|nr:hypothetical protein [Parasphingopyxis algicola]